VEYRASARSPPQRVPGSVSILILTLPWVLLFGFLTLVVRLPRPLPMARWTGAPPRVSVIVPARNEAGNVERVLRSLAASEWPDLEIILVDDRSEDATAEIARGVARELHHPTLRIQVVEGQELPEGWLGKPWACMQGAQAATGEVLLFTDADTRHGPDLLGRAVTELRASGAGALTLAGRQLMESFWEAAVQPQIFTSMLLRYWNQRDRHPPERWRDAIANGQFIMFERETYTAIGGHEAVRGEVVEDLKMAQQLVRSGHALEIRMAEDAFATRMYESLGDIVRGWSKNVVLGGIATIPPGWLRRITPPFMVFGGAVLWLLPVVVLGWMLVAGATGVLLGWSLAVVGMTALFWSVASARMGVSPLYGLAYPLGAAVTTYIFLRAWLRGGQVEWKGRRYQVRGLNGEGEPGGLD